MDQRRLSVLLQLLDGRRQPTMATGARVPFLFRMEAEGLIFSTARYAGRHRQRDWSITLDGIRARLQAEAAGLAPTTPPDTLRRIIAEHEDDARVCDAFGTPYSVKRAEELRTFIAVYREFPSPVTTPP